jgi:hypothetical protein
MTTGSFQPLSARDRGLPRQQILHEGVPSHMETFLRAWIARALRGGGAAQVALRLQIATGRGNPIDLLAQGIDEEYLLDVVDAILGYGGPWPELNPGDMQLGRNSNYTGLKLLRRDLIGILEAGSSAWRVNDDFTGLTRRVDRTVAAAAEAATGTADNAADAGSAADHLRAGWTALYQLHPDASGAYRDAIRAVEAAAHGLVEPNNTRATFGTMLRQLRDNPDRWVLAIRGPGGTGSIMPLIAMIELLWTGQTSRHGGQTPTRPETFEEAQMAVHLAVTLVQWFVTGAVSQRT